MLARFGNLLVTSYEIWIESNASRNSAAMTYYTMLSLAPLLLIAIAIASVFFCDQEVEQQIIGYFRDIASPQVAQTIGGLLRNTTSPQHSLLASLISLAILLYGASGIFTQLFDTINDIWQVPVHQRSGLRFSVKKRLIGILMVLGVGALLLTSLCLGAVISSINQWLDGKLPQLASWLSLVDRGLNFILLPFVLSLIFWYLPMRKIRWPDVWPAAGLTAALLAASRYLIDFYLRISTASEVYGAAGSLVMLLVWVYLTGLVLFFGASFSRAWTRSFGSESSSQSLSESLSESLNESLSESLSESPKELAAESRLEMEPTSARLADAESSLASDWKSDAQTVAAESIESSAASRIELNPALRLVQSVIDEAQLSDLAIEDRSAHRFPARSMTFAFKIRSQEATEANVVGSGQPGTSSDAGKQIRPQIRPQLRPQTTTMAASLVSRSGPAVTQRSSAEPSLAPSVPLHSSTASSSTASSSNASSSNARSSPVRQELPAALLPFPAAQGSPDGRFSGETDAIDSPRSPWRHWSAELAAELQPSAQLGQLGSTRPPFAEAAADIADIAGIDDIKKAGEFAETAALAPRRRKSDSDSAR